MRQEGINAQTLSKGIVQVSENIFEKEKDVMEKGEITVHETQETIPATVNAENGDYTEVKKWVDESLAESLPDASELSNDILKSNNIEKILEATKQAIRENNKMENFRAGAAAGYGVRVGNYLGHLKDVVKASGEIWEDFATKNLPGLSLRTIQKYIRISKIPGVQSHLVYGIERLYLLGPVVENIESADPISVFLSKHNLQFDPTVEMDFDDFKRRIDEIKLKETAAANDIDISPETAAKMAEKRLHPTSDILAKAKMVKENGGDTEKFFQNLVASVTKTNPNSGKNGTTTSKSKQKGFNKLASELKDIIKIATTNKEVLKSIDLKNLDELLADLETLKVHLAKQ